MEPVPGATRNARASEFSILSRQVSEPAVFGAGDEIRTRDILLGRQKLYH